MRPVLTGSLLALFLAAQPASSQELKIPAAVYPVLARSAPNPAGFVPKGWQIERSVTGDLNADRRSDLAFVLRQRSAANVLDASRHFGPRRFDTNPRILAVALSEPGGGYRLVLENHSLISRTELPHAEDHFDENNGELEIKRGVLRVGMRIAQSSGSYGVGRSNFAFRFRENRFVLIGYDGMNFMRNLGEIREVSVNYLTRRMKITVGHISSDRDKVSWKSLPQRALLTVDEIGDGILFKAMPD